MEKTIERDYVEDIDYDSFIEESRSQRTPTGESRLKSVELVEDPPVDVKIRYKKFDVYKFETLDGKNVYISQDKSIREWDVIKEWTGVRDISELAGKKIPIQEISDGVYTVADFRLNNKDLDTAFKELPIDYDTQTGLSVSDAKYLYDNNYIEYHNGKWTVSESLVETYQHRSKIQEDQKSLFRYALYSFMFGIFIEPVNLLFFIFLISYFVFLTIRGIFDKMSLRNNEKYLKSMYKYQDDIDDAYLDRNFKIE